MDNLIDKIINYKIPCYFISPHLDDAVFSAGDLIAYLAGSTEVQVVNIFTDGGGKRETLSAKQFLKQCGVGDATKLFEERRSEDSQVFSSLNINPQNLGYLDALWRTKSQRFPIAEFNAIYPVYRIHVTSGKIAKADLGLVDQIAEKLKEMVPENAIVFAPVGVGSHVDHIITREVASRLPNLIIYWTDFPYHLQNGVDRKFILDKSLVNSIFSHDLSAKTTLVSGYKSQIKAMFPDGVINLQSEVYYLPLKGIW